ncbi:MAG: hypothetical protein JXR70_05990 [Spirochaetales bacterium]|nr:hypothetical protein [Spirochaetales bacterium]
MLRSFLIFLLIGFAAFTGFGQSRYSDDVNSDGKDDKWFSVNSQGEVDMEEDRNFDGTVDCKVNLDGLGRATYEEFDENYDGKMDTFFYYKKGALNKQEIDSNFDGKVDIWVYLIEGIYIQRYEVDKDFDGVVDKVKDYSPAEMKKKG